MAIGNKDVEVLSEALFCYYFAIYKKGKQGKMILFVWGKKNCNNFYELFFSILRKIHIG